MDVTHGKSFLDCAISGSPISQMTIMHAYQTCIKRIVRFANSLQVSWIRVPTLSARTTVWYVLPLMIISLVLRYKDYQGWRIEIQMVNSHVRSRHMIDPVRDLHF